MTMRVAFPVVIGDEQLVSSSIPETEHPMWDVETAYTTGEDVIHAHRIWRALEATTGDEPTAEATEWQDRGPTNQFAMFDQRPDYLSSRSGSIEFVFAPGTAGNVLHLVNVLGTTARLEISDSSGTLQYAEDRSLVDTSLLVDWYLLLHGEPSRVSNVTFDDLPIYPDGQYRVILQEGAGIAHIGVCVFGLTYQIGRTQRGSELEYDSFSRVDEDEFGYTDILRRGFRTRRDYTVTLDNVQLEATERLVTRMRDRVVLILPARHRPALTVWGFLRGWRATHRTATISEYRMQAISLPFNEPETLFAGGFVTTPSVTLPAAGFTFPDGGTVRSSAFVASPPGSDTHEWTDWQFSATSDFAVIHHESLADDENLTSYAVPAATFTETETYLARVRQRGVLYGNSPWSAPVPFVAGPDLEIVTPVITAPTEAQSFPRNQLITTEAFATDPAAQDTHDRSVWRIASDEAMTSIVYTLESSTHLTTLPVPDALTTGATYYVDVQFIGDFNIPSERSAVREFVAAHPAGQAMWTVPGTYILAVPAHVTTISGVVVGAGGLRATDESGDLYVEAGGGGGALQWFRGVAVTPGQQITVVVGAKGSQGDYNDNPSANQGGGSSISVAGLGTIAAAYGGKNAYLFTSNVHRLYGGPGGTRYLKPGVTGGGGNGGKGGDTTEAGWSDNGHGHAGAGGAGGYNGNGGGGGNLIPSTHGIALEDDGWVAGTAGASGGGGGGASHKGGVDPDEDIDEYVLNPILRHGAPGGGVGLYGQGSNGAGGTAESPAGKGGSGGADGVIPIGGNGFYANGTITGGLFGGGGITTGGANGPGTGGVRIIWGDGRFYPSTNTGDV